MLNKIVSDLNQVVTQLTKTHLGLDCTYTFSSVASATSSELAQLPCYLLSVLRPHVSSISIFQFSNWAGHPIYTFPYISKTIQSLKNEVMKIHTNHPSVPFYLYPIRICML